MEEKILEITHVPGEEIVVRFRPCYMRQMPTAARQHLRTARKEMLLAMRNLIDVVLESTEARERKGRKARTKVEVE
ncbi:MAG: hypothetical protein AB1603_01135 [Chloroflexota bacterium]